MPDGNELAKSDAVIETIKAELAAASPTRKQRIREAIALAALGSIPWVGGVLAASATFKFDEAGVRQDDLRTQWLAEHQQRLQDLRTTLGEMFARIESLGVEVEDRLESPEYLGLIRKTFREWDQADTQEERGLLAQLITNAAGLRICTDDILSLFLDWIRNYHESHFAVIREIYKNPGPTRYDIWVAVYGETIPRDDSANADLYKLLIGDLQLGRVIRQPRASDNFGRYQKKATRTKPAFKTITLESPFEDTKQYVLTELGKQFVHYTMTELVTRLETGSEPEEK
jgi:hypothetical protein